MVDVFYGTGSFIHLLDVIHGAGDFFRVFGGFYGTGGFIQWVDAVMGAGGVYVLGFSKGVMDEGCVSVRARG